MSNNRGLLLLFAEPGQDKLEAEYNEWYDNEHAPQRLQVPGFHNAIRYKATDNRTPSWVLTYDLESPAAVQSDAYKALVSNASDKEKAIISSFATLDRRVYDRYSLRTKLGVPDDTFPAKFLLVVAIQAPASIDEEFNKWYEEEHIGEIAKCRGWLRCRRYKLVEQSHLAGNADLEKKVHNYIALHDFDNNDYITSPEFIAACSTPWTNKIRELINNEVDMRTYTLFKNIQKS